MPSYYEFFAGGGMARAGLGKKWTCLFANDVDPKKSACYVENWGHADLSVKDVGALKTKELPGYAELVWASFPCQDLSLAGTGKGLKGKRSGTFWPFWKLMKGLIKEDRAPKIIVLENVCGVLSSGKGKDFAALSEALVKAGYHFGAIVMDAVHFLPQSRPRLFIICVQNHIEIPTKLKSSNASDFWHTKPLIKAQQAISRKAQNAWIWWSLPLPNVRSKRLSDLIEMVPHGVKWHSTQQTERLLELMSPVNLKKVKDAQKAGGCRIGTIYRRTRRDEFGKRVQRAEIRFDDIAGCLRTPAGGSSRQTIMIVKGKEIRSRLLSPREAARLMGLPDAYKLPENYNEAYKLAGDGLVVPVVRFLAKQILEPLNATVVDINREAA